MLGQWKVEPKLNKLSCEEHEVILVPKVMAILLVLVEAEGEPLNLKTLMECVWKEQVVSDSSVYQAIAQLRKALGDTAAEPHYIQRVSGKGYRLVAEVKVLAVEASCESTDIDNEKRISSSEQTHKGETFNAKTWAVVAVLCVSILLLCLLLIQWPQTVNQQTKPLAIAQVNSISVKRLNTEQLGEVQQLDALNDVLLTQLMQIRPMRVVSLGKGTPEVTTQTVLSGKITKQGDSVRVFIQLKQAESQEVIWAQAFDGDVQNLFALQDNIVDSLLSLFKQASRPSVFHAAKVDNLTFDQYLLGRHLWQQRSANALYRAKAVFEEMQRQNQLFPLAAVALCDTYHYLNIYADWSFNQALNKCSPLLQQALSEQPDLGQAIAANALLLSRQGHKNKASEMFEKAIKLAPNYPFSYVWYAEQNRRMGNYQQGLSMMQTAYALAPMSPIVNRGLAYAYLNAGKKTQARFYYRRALDLQFEYTDRAIEELDFLPLTIERARNFLSWSEQHPNVMEKRRSYQLTQAQVNLALGNFSAVADTLLQLENQQVNPSFKLFIETSLAAAQVRYHDVISLIEQRMRLHQDNGRYAGAYLLALELLQQNEKAYAAFLKLRPDLAKYVLNQENNAAIEVTASNRKLLAYFVQLQARRGAMNSVNQLAQQLDESFAKEDTPRDIYYARWLLFRGDKDLAKKETINLMKNGWLPDYNAQLYPEAIMQKLFIETDLGKETYQAMLEQNRAKVIAVKR